MPSKKDRGQPERDTAPPIPDKARTGPRQHHSWHEQAADTLPYYQKHRRDRRPKPPPPVAAGSLDGDLEGLVLSRSSRVCWVMAEGEELRCHLPSRLAMHQQSALAVGDRVQIREEEDGQLWVTGVLPRRTALSRPDPHNPRLERVIAANIDTVVIVVALRKPGLKPGLVDRYLLAVEKGGARPVLCVNKIDLVESPEDDAEWHLLDPYRELGVPIFPVSAKQEEGLEELLADLAGETCVLVGHSGVGKSSLLNAFHPQLELTTREVRSEDGTGRHTTTRAVLYVLEEDTQIIDTPGIRELGLWDLSPDDLRGAFPDLAAHADGCRFANCTHTHEPQCAVQAAVETDDLPAARYEAYRRILESLEEKASR